MDISNEQLYNRCICFITKIIIARTHCFPVYAFTRLWFDSRPMSYTLDSMNSYEIIFNEIEIGLPK